jgi:hypothetical protein
MIEPKLGVSYEVLSSFTNRLKAEYDPNKLAVTEDAEDEFLAYWYIPLLPNQVEIYTHDPAVCDTMEYEITSNLNRSAQSSHTSK